jgi:hypothetical protein
LCKPANEYDRRARSETTNALVIEQVNSTPMQAWLTEQRPPTEPEKQAT